MNVVILGVFGTKLIAALTASSVAGPALVLFGLALAGLLLAALRRSAEEKTRIVQRIELPPAIVRRRGRANTRRNAFGTSRAPPLRDPIEPEDQAGFLRRE